MTDEQITSLVEKHFEVGGVQDDGSFSEYYGTLDTSLKYQTKKRKSYLGRIPSQHFGEDEYDLFLSIATPEELEEDIITRDTHRKITNQLEWD